MRTEIRGADLLVRSLEQAGCRNVFTLSGNHIMPLFDAALGSKLRLLHVRHEAAAVHMADAWGRLTGQCGIALVSGGAAHANAMGALATAVAADSPLVLLSGHAGLNELGRGAFQELRQVEMAAPVSKAAWVAETPARLGQDIARAIRTAVSGRPGPVHVSLPFDVLNARVPLRPAAVPEPEAFAAQQAPLEAAAADATLRHLAEARRALILGGPRLCQRDGPALLRDLSAATGVPALGLESPRGLNDPSLGAFAEVLRRADLIVLLGKALDFTLRFGEAPHVAPQCRFIGIDADADQLARLQRHKADRVLFAASAEAAAAALSLRARCRAPVGHGAWAEEVASALAYRPPHWETLAATNPRALHPIELCRALAPYVEGHAAAVLICDGGEIGQWPQAALAPHRRLINGVAGAIGAALPFALAARLAEPNAPVLAVMGDGSCGFHMAEFDTAVRHDLPFVAVIGNDATWNAEHQIQLREYGPERTHACGLLPSRYDLVAAALGGHGECVTAAEALPGALERALAARKPACINVMIERVPAPTCKP
jgi:thiamine pyrophosphate-dependent acetolactate synthase large subunit-like protein